MVPVNFSQQNNDYSFFCIFVSKVPIFFPVKVRLFFFSLKNPAYYASHIFQVTAETGDLMKELVDIQFKQCFVETYILEVIHEKMIERCMLKILLD